MHQISLCIWYTFTDSIPVYLCSLNCIYSSQLLIYRVRCILLTAGVCHGFEVMTESESTNTTFSCVTSSFQECLKWIIYHNTCHALQYSLNPNPDSSPVVTLWVTIYIGPITSIAAAGTTSIRASTFRPTTHRSLISITPWCWSCHPCFRTWILLCIWHTFIDSIPVYLCSLNCIYSCQLLIYSVRCILLTAGACHGFEVMTESPKHPL